MPLTGEGWDGGSLRVSELGTSLLSKIPPKGNELANRKKQGLRVDGEVFPDLIHSFQLAAGGLWFQYFTLYNWEICAIQPRPSFKGRAHFHLFLSRGALDGGCDGFPPTCEGFDGGCGGFPLSCGRFPLGCGGFSPSCGAFLGCCGGVPACCDGFDGGCGRFAEQLTDELVHGLSVPPGP